MPQKTLPKVVAQMQTLADVLDLYEAAVTQVMRKRMPSLMKD